MGTYQANSAQGKLSNVVQFRPRRHVSWSARHQARARHWPSWPAAYHALIYAIRDVALTPKGKRLVPFRAAASTGAAIVADRQLDRRTVTDRLWQASEAYDLVDDHGADAIQQILSEAFAA